MKRKKILTYSILVIFLLGGGITFLVASQQNLDVKYFETFHYSDFSKPNEITFINQLKEKETENKWYIKVYFNQNGEVIKFETKDKENNIYETISDTSNLQVKYKNIKS